MILLIICQQFFFHLISEEKRKVRFIEFYKVISSQVAGEGSSKRYSSFITKQKF